MENNPKGSSRATVDSAEGAKGKPTQPDEKRRGDNPQNEEHVGQAQPAQHGPQSAGNDGGAEPAGPALVTFANYGSVNPPANPAAYFGNRSSVGSAASAAVSVSANPAATDATTSAAKATTATASTTEPERLNWRIRTPYDLGLLIAWGRERKGLTQQQLAERAHVSRSWLAQVEVGKMAFDFRRVLMVLYALDLCLEAQYA